MVKIYKSSEQGASLITALVFMVALFLVVTSAMKFQRSTADNISQVSISSQERWAARGLTARAAGWLESKLPVEYKSDLQTALRNCENKNLPAFNPPENSLALPCENSNLGNIQDWLNSKKAAAVSFALENNQSARVTVNLTEAYRTSSGGTTQYKISYLVDGGNSETYGTDTNQGEIFLGELETCTCELKLSSSSYSVPVGDPITLTAEFWNIEQIQLYENNVLVDSSPVQNLKTRQVKSWTRTINAETTFFVKGYVVANNCNAISNRAVVVMTTLVPTPTPTPSISPTPTPTPPASESITLNGTVIYQACSGEMLDYTTSRTFEIENNRFNVNFNTGPNTAFRFSIRVLTDIETVEIYQNGGFNTFQAISSARGNITATLVNNNSIEIQGRITEYAKENYPTFNQFCEYSRELVR
jgi:hypothetical protein